ncbi:MAG: hypothetical protein V7459_09060 [Oceanicoccus sp.]
MMVYADYPVLVLIIALALSLLLMYLIRPHAHDLILRSSRLLYSQSRLLSRACLRSAQRIRLRNHELTKTLVEALMERQLERRFMRIEQLVERDLANYQKLSASINRQLVVIDEDYIDSAKVPEVSPEWVSAVDSIARLQSDERNTEVVGKILEDMHQTVQNHHRDALREHRWTVSSRHKVLTRLRPHWRKLSKMLHHIDNNIEVLRLRLRQVDQHMSQFEMLTAGSGQGVMSSMLIRFVSSLCFVLVGVGAAAINWQLLTQPALSMMPSPAIVGGVSFAEIVVGLHIATTLIAATMVSEGLRITHLFPLVSAMTRRGRQAMILTGAGLLLALAIIEALALLSSPMVVGSTPASGVSTGLLIAIGVVMPLVLALVIIPLEYMLHTVRPVMGSLLQVLMHVSALVCRLAASLLLHAGRLLVNCYDLLIFVPLRLETYWVSRLQRQSTSVATEPEPKADISDTPVDAPNVTALKFGPVSPKRHH